MLEGEKTAFLRFDEVEWAWRILDPVLKAWSKGEPDLHPAAGEGPDSQNRLLSEGHHWRSLQDDLLPSHDR